MLREYLKEEEEDVCFLGEYLKEEGEDVCLLFVRGIVAQHLGNYVSDPQ